MRGVAVKHIVWRFNDGRKGRLAVRFDNERVSFVCVAGTPLFPAAMLSAVCRGVVPDADLWGKALHEERARHCRRYVREIRPGRLALYEQSPADEKYGIVRRKSILRTPNILFSQSAERPTTYNLANLAAFWGVVEQFTSTRMPDGVYYIVNAEGEPVGQFQVHDVVVVD